MLASGDLAEVGDTPNTSRIEDSRELVKRTPLRITHATEYWTQAFYRSPAIIQARIGLTVCPIRQRGACLEETRVYR